MTESVDEPALFHEGIRLFNEQDWFEAHEVWEDIWREASGDRKRFYQGLIQCAVTIEHVRRGNPRGVLSVWTTAQTKFTGLPSPYMGIAVGQLLADVKALIDPVLSLPESSFDPALPRGQDLPVNWTLAPRITLADDPFRQ